MKEAIDDECEKASVTHIIIDIVSRSCIAKLKQGRACSYKGCTPTNTTQDFPMLGQEISICNDHCTLKSECV